MDGSPARLRTHCLGFRRLGFSWFRVEDSGVLAIQGGAIFRLSTAVFAFRPPSRSFASFLIHLRRLNSVSETDRYHRDRDIWGFLKKKAFGVL